MCITPLKDTQSIYLIEKINKQTNFLMDMHIILVMMEGL
jgi:hypothetical protein